MATLLPETRVVASDVRDIIATVLPDEQLHAFINSAHRMVEANLLESGLADATLTEIELWLSAHLLSLRDQRLESIDYGDGTKSKFQGKTGTGLNATLYGQQVLALDSTGILAALGVAAAKTASLRVLP